MRCAMILVSAALLADPALSQTGGTAIPTTTIGATISLGTARPAAAFRSTATPLRS